MLSHSSVYPGAAPWTPWEEARLFAALLDVVRSVRPDILRGVAASVSALAAGSTSGAARSRQEHPIGGASDARRAQVEDMRVDHGGADVAVAEELLDSPDVVVVL
jgi:hypothetical protein